MKRLVSDRLTPSCCPRPLTFSTKTCCSGHLLVKEPPIDDEAVVNQSKMLMRLGDYLRVPAAESAHGSGHGAQASAHMHR